LCRDAVIAAPTKVSFTRDFHFQFRITVAPTPAGLQARSSGGYGANVYRRRYPRISYSDVEPAALHEDSPPRFSTRRHL